LVRVNDYEPEIKKAIARGDNVNCRRILPGYISNGYYHKNISRISSSLVFSALHKWRESTLQPGEPFLAPIPMLQQRFTIITEYDQG